MSGKLSRLKAAPEPTAISVAHANSVTSAKSLTHTEALRIVVEAARSYAEIALDRKGNGYGESATEIWRAIEKLQTPPLFQSTFKYTE